MFYSHYEPYTVKRQCNELNTQTKTNYLKNNEESLMMDEKNRLGDLPTVTILIIALFQGEFTLVSTSRNKFPPCLS